MNNQKTLYIIIAILVVFNIATLSYFFGSYRSSRFMGYGMMGRNHMNGSDEHWKEHDEISTWEGMVEHMEEEHGEMGMMHSEVDYNKPVAESHNKSYDLGQVSRTDGVVNTSFEIENHGKQPLEIGEISTSCGCTSAEVDKTTLEFDETAELKVYFDPNFHEEPLGKITRSVFVPTNDPDNSEIQFDIYVEIVD